MYFWPCVRFLRSVELIFFSRSHVLLFDRNGKNTGPLAWFSRLMHALPTNDMIIVLKTYPGFDEQVFVFLLKIIIFFLIFVLVT